MSKLRLRKPSPALVISCIALFVALSGSSYAVIVLPKNSVGAKQIKTNAVGPTEIAKNAVRAEEVRDGSLSAADFAPGQLAAGPPGPPGPPGPSNPNADTLDAIDSTGFLRNGAAAGGDLTGSYPNPTIRFNSISTFEVADNSLTGNDIDEATLGQVPSAATAASAVDADKVSGIRVFEIAYRTAANTASVLVFNVGGLRLTASCDAGDIEVLANTSENNNMLWVFAHNNALSFPDLDIADPGVDVVDLDDNTAGTIVYARPNGSHVTISFLAEEDPFGSIAPDAQDCVFVGTAFVTP